MPFHEESGSPAFGREPASDSPVMGLWDLRLSLEGRAPSVDGVSAWSSAYRLLLKPYCEVTATVVPGALLSPLPWVLSFIP